MPSEIKTTPTERLADLEAKFSGLSRRADVRSKVAKLIHSSPPRVVRTQGDDPTDPNDPTYPEQVDGKGARLPIVFLDLIYDDAEDADDPVYLLPRASKPQAWLYSPFGWIPRLIDLQVYEQNGLYFVSQIPELDIQFSENVLPGNSGTVAMVRSGIATGQEFEVWFDHMAGLVGVASDTDEAVAKLSTRRKLWVVDNKEC